MANVDRRRSLSRVPLFRDWSVYPSIISASLCLGHISWNENKHNNLARIVLISSPVRLRGSILILAPSISPTSNSEFGTPSALPCPDLADVSVESFVSESVFVSDSTAESRSGGALLAPTLGKSLVIVDSLLETTGFSGFDCCLARHSFVSSQCGLSAKNLDVEV